MNENKTLEIEEIKQQLQLEKDNVAELNELLISVKQENEKLDNECQDKFNTIMKLDDEIKQLKQENKELKEGYKQAGIIWEHLCRQKDNKLNKILEILESESKE